MGHPPIHFNSTQCHHQPECSKEEMPIKEEDYQLNFIRKELEDSRERNFSLERENDQLKQEVARLRAKISSLKAQTLERKSSLRKKLSTSIDVNFQEDCSSVEKTNTAETVTKTEKLAKPVRPSTKTVLPDQVDVKKVSPPPAQPSGNTPPPPPPPPPSKFLTGSANVVRRVPGVMEFYRSLTRKDTKVPNQNSFLGVQLAANTRNMIGEIENRSRYLMAIKSDVETQGGMIRYLTREVENAAYTDISDVETFVRWLDRQLSSLVDERAVLKHFPQWPEQKADAMREASFTYRDLKNLESEVTSFTDNPKEPVSISLKRMQALQDRLERSVHGVERTRESLSKKYREYRIPWDWMLDTGMIKQLKLSSMGLAKEYMRRVTRELQSKECSQEDLMLQGARFAFRVHQFAGGFDTLAMQAFEEFRKMDTEHGQPQHGISGI